MQLFIHDKQQREPVTLKNGTETVYLRKHCIYFEIEVFWRRKERLQKEIQAYQHTLVINNASKSNETR